MGKVIMQGGGGGLVDSDELTATANKVLKGFTYMGKDTDNESGEGTVEVQSILSFSVAPYSVDQFLFTWKNPAKGAYSGVIIVGRTDRYPTNSSDGTRWYKGYGNSSSANASSQRIQGGFAVGTTYYFAAFSYAIKDNEEWLSEKKYAATAKTTSKGMQTFTSSGTFTVPAGVRTIDIFCVGGGGAGVSGYDTSQENPSVAGGGGGGYTSTRKGYAVAPGAKYNVLIGAGAVPAASGTGGTTSFSGTESGSIVSAAGGYGGGSSSSQYSSGHDGGSGGGAAVGLRSCKGGGSNGSDGGGNDNTPGGKGQGITTRAFGESTGTLYAGGGGAGVGSTNYSRGAGGAGGGGAGSAGRDASDGSANTGGGGGGQGGNAGVRWDGGTGGSGICIVRWGY